MIDIKDISGNSILSTPINEGCKRKFTLMKEDYILLKFSSENPVFFKLGSYAECDFGLFEVCDLQKPAFNTLTAGYDYELRLDSHYWKWKNKVFKFTPETGGQEASWHLTATLDVQAGIILRNLKALGYKYKGQDFVFSIDSTVENKAQLMTYENINILDALFSMAKKWDCECWVTENVIHFGRCEFGDSVSFEIGVNVDDMTRSESQSTYATRIYAFGSTRNIPSNYRPASEQIVVNGIVQKRLMLPEGIPYIDAYPNMTMEEAVEQIVMFDEVYPRRTGTMSDVSTKEYTDTIENEDGTTTEQKWDAYRFKDTGVTFSKDYILPGEELKIQFQSGKLNGMTFSVIFDPDNKDEQLWEIVRNEDYGRPLPDEVLCPENGDTYVLSGWDSTKIAELGLVDAAEEELKGKAEEYVEKSKIAPDTYTCKMMSDSAFSEDGLHNLYGAGQKVNLINEAYFDNGRLSRVIGFEFNLDFPYDSPTYTVGETAAYSRIGEIEKKLENITLSGQTYTGETGSGVYLIRRNDSTPATDSNAFSALRSLSMFLRKDKADRTPYKVSSDTAFEVGDFVPGSSGAIVYKDKETGQTIGEIDKFYFRMKAYFESLEIVNVNSLGGKQVISPAGSVRLTMAFGAGDKYEIVTEGEDGNDVVTEVTVPQGTYRCFFLAEQDGQEVENRFKVGNQLQSKDFNIKKPGEYNQVANHYYWRLVTGVSVEPVRIGELGYHYVDLSVTDCDTGSDVPAKGDVVAQLGDRNDADYQNALVFSSVDTFSPSITLYQGINSYSLVGKDVVSYGVDKTTGKAFMNVYGEMYIGDRGGSTFVRYTQENGVEIKGKLAVGTKLGDGKTIEQALEDATQSAVETSNENVNKLSTTVNTLSGTVSGMKDFTDTAFADGIVDRSEASAIDKYQNNINTTKADAQNAYSKVYENALLDGVAKTNLANAYNAFSASATELVTSITNAIADGKTTSAERADVDAKYTNFNTKYGDFVAYLNAANKYIQDKINATANNALTQIGGLAYLKQALKEDTTIEGGLIQSSVLALGYTNEGGVYKVMSGTNGIYDSSRLGGGIASWWGGAMKDRGNYTASNMPSDVAKALIRMDGSGYLANGGVWWGTDGKIHADPQSFIINENQLGDYLELFQIIYKGGTKEIDYMIPQYVMQKVDVASYVTIGGVKLKKHSDGVLEIDGDLLVTGGVTMYAQGTHTASTILDALPIDTSTLSKDGGVLSVIGGGGGSSIAGIKVNGGTYVPGADKYITIPDYPTSLAWSGISGKPTTLAGYNITDAKIDGGVITLGANSITPITAHQSLDAYMYFAVYQNYVSARFNNKALSQKASETYIELWDNLSGTGSTANGWWNIMAGKFIKNDGTASQFLMADGSVKGTYDVSYASKTRFLEEATGLARGSNDSSIELPSSLPAGIRTRFKNATGASSLFTWNTIVDMTAYSGDSNSGAGYRNQFLFSNSNNYSDGSFFVRNGVNSTWYEWRKVLTDGNYAGIIDSRYVKRAGDTMTGVLHLQGANYTDSYSGALNLNNSNIYGVNSIYTSDPAEKSDEGIHFYRDATHVDTLWASNGVLRFVPNRTLGSSSTTDGNVIWHAGNDGSGSGLDADLLDGLHYTAFARTDQWQGVDLNTLNGFGIMMNNANADATAARHYPIQEAGTLFYGTAAYASSNQIYGSYNSNRWFFRGGGTSVNAKTAWKEMAFLSSNVSSATKLQTARSIWGQSFDGTGNVSGSLTSVTDITASGLIKAERFSGVNIRIECDNSGALAGHGAEINCFNSALYLQHHTSNNAFICTGGGNVGIGTTAPSYKLHVAGTIFTNNAIIGRRYATNSNAAAFVFDKPGSNYTGIGSDGTANTIRLSACDSAGNWVSYEQIWKFYGNILTTGGVTMYSDLRKKNVLGDTSLSLDKICAAPLFRFTYKDDDKSTLHIGSSAQYWQDVPGIVSTDSEGKYLTMDYNSMLSAVTLSLAKYTKKHETEIEKLKMENIQLRQRIEFLERRVA